MNGRIAFDRNLSIYSVQPSGRGLTRIAARTRLHANLSAEWSPDGSTLAVVSAEFTPNGSSTLTLMDAQGSNAHLVPTPGFEVGDATWSPDGTQFALAGAPNGRPSVISGLYSVPLSGGTPISFGSTLRGDISHVEWSPTGTRLAFTKARDPSDARSLYVMNADGSNLRRLTKGRLLKQDLDPDWSPNGRQLVFARDAVSGAGIYVTRINGSIRRLTRTDDFAPVWSPDGRQIAFVRPRGGALGYLRPKGLYVMNADGSAPRRIFAWKRKRNAVVMGLDWQPTSSSG